MENRKVSHWMDSISSVIRKTEMNLTMINRKPAYVTMEPSEEREEVRDDISFQEMHRELNAVRAALERNISDKAASHKTEVEQLMNRLAEAELKQTHSSTQVLEEQQHLRAQFEDSLQQKSAELQQRFRDFVLRSELQSTETALKQMHASELEQLQRKLDAAFGDLESVQERISKEIEEKLKGLAGRFVRPQELESVKSELLQNSDLKMKQVEASLKAQLATLQADLLAHSQSKLEAARTAIKTEMENELQQAQMEIDELTQTVTALKMQLNQQQLSFESKLSTLAASAEAIESEIKRMQDEVTNIREAIEAVPEDDQTLLEVSAKFAELERRMRETANSKDAQILKSLEERVLSLEANLSQVDSGVSDDADIDISAGEALPMEERRQVVPGGLATFGKDVSPQGSSELMTITINDMGESDEADSADYVSPHISPMNKWVSQHTSMLQKAEEAKKEPKQFNFDDLKVPITEVSHEEEAEELESSKKEDKVNRLLDHFVQREVALALQLVSVDDLSEAEFSGEEVDLP